MMDVTFTKSIKLPSEFKLYLEHHNIIEAIQKMADQINYDYSSRKDCENIVVLPLMTGAMVFCAHLLTMLRMPIVLDYLHISRYGHNTVGENITFHKKPDLSLKGRTVIIVDDMIDEGNTILESIKFCADSGASNIKTAVLLDKQHKRKAFNSIKADYTGFFIEDKYVFGFGIDYKKQYRNLPDIYYMER